MKLGDGSRAYVDLRILDYQFPDECGRGLGEDGDWDANWLIVAGDVVTEAGNAWSFREPCLTTWEAQRLGAWLSGVAHGSVPCSHTEGLDAEDTLDFIEPNLAFSLIERSSRGVAIGVRLSEECVPLWLAEHAAPGGLDYVLVTRTSMAQLKRAVADWEHSTREHPAR